MTCRYVRGCLAAFSCGPHRAPDAGCALLQVGKQGKWGIAAGSTAPPSPPLPTVPPHHKSAAHTIKELVCTV